MAVGLALRAGQPALATVAVTQATGGANLPVGQFVALSGPSITEGASADSGAGTIVLQVPVGFAFDTTPSAVTASVSSTGACQGSSKPLRLGYSSRNSPSAPSVPVAPPRAERRAARCGDERLA